MILLIGCSLSASLAHLSDFSYSESHLRLSHTVDNVSHHTYPEYFQQNFHLCTIINQKAGGYLINCSPKWNVRFAEVIAIMF